MRLFELNNPLGFDAAAIDAMLERFSDAEGEYGTRMGYTWAGGEVIRKIQENLGEVQDVPISKIVSTEPELNDEHLAKIKSGIPYKASSKLPWAYFYGGKYYVNDGNHRVVAAHLAGEKTVKMVVVPFMSLLLRNQMLARKSSSV
jgi:hypothetical protein